MPLPLIIYAPSPYNISKVFPSNSGKKLSVLFAFMQFSKPEFVASLALFLAYM